MSDCTGKVILIAGALGTVGAGIAAGFHAKGATVLIAPDPLFSQDLMALYAGFICIDCAVSDPDVLALRCDAIVAQHGRLDLIIFCNGTAPPQSTRDVPVSSTRSRPPTLFRRLRAKLISII